MGIVLIEHFYLYFQGILLFQVAFFMMLFVITQRKEILFYCLFIFTNTCYFYLNAPNTFFYVNDDVIFNAKWYEIVNHGLICCYQYLYIRFILSIFFEWVDIDIRHRIYRYSLIGLVILFLLFTILALLHIDRHLLFYISKIFSIPPVLYILWITRTQKSKFVLLVQYGTIFNILGSIITVLMIIRYNQGIRVFALDEYPLMYMKFGILIDIVFYQLAILSKWQDQETELKTKDLQSQLEVANLKNHISRSLHDDIGTSLSKINLLSFMAQKKLENESFNVHDTLESIQKNIQQLVEKIQKSSWFSTDNQPDFDLAQNIMDFAQPMCLTKNITLRENGSQNIPPLLLYEKIQISYIAKEAINNAVKYSNCKHLDLNYISDRRILKIFISDDGKGFDMAKINRKNGINNMQYRANSINASFNILSNEEKGTKIEMELLTVQ